MTPDFKTLLDEKKAKWISQAGAELSARTEVKRWWPDVHGDSRFAAVTYLNTKTSVKNDAETSKLYVTDPMVDGETMPGNWRLGYSAIEEGRSGVVQVLRKGFLITLESGKRETKYFTDTTTLTRFVPEADIADYMDEALGDNVMVNSDVRRGSEEGYYDIEVTIRTMKGGITSFVSGKRETKYFTDTTTMTRNVPEADISSYMDEALGDNVMVNSDVR
ncbi:MAG: hypothetical protein PHP93_03395, partial [Kiritimatiellales bacterium]|nr:hypothetical protein [Kiritimatiellales bacterium]